MTELKQAEPLRSDKLVLRPLTLGDAVHYAQLLDSDSASIQMTATISDPSTDDVREWLTLRLDRGKRVFAILNTADGEFVGALWMIQQLGGAFVLGYWVGRVYAGKGYASEAVR